MMEYCYLMRKCVNLNEFLGGDKNFDEYRSVIKSVKDYVVDE